MTTVDSATVFVPFFFWSLCHSPHEVLLLLRVFVRGFAFLARNFFDGRDLCGGAIGLDADLFIQCPGFSLAR